MAAITAARNGAKVTLLEKNRQTGKKLLVTGNGRCNFTNRNQELSNYRTDRPDLVKEALESFSVDDTVDFFESLGILTKERNGYLYPGSGQASSIADVLRLTAVKEGVKIACDTQALAVKRINDRFAVETEGWTYEADALINQLCHYGVDREYAVLTGMVIHLQKVWDIRWWIHCPL